MSNHRDADIERRYLAGESLASIARDYSLTRERVRQIVVRRGLESPRSRSRRRAIVAAQEVRASGAKVSITAAARAAGVHPRLVREALTELGFDPVAHRQAQIDQQRLERLKGRGKTTCNQCGKVKSWGQMALTTGRGKPRRKRTCRECVAENSRAYYAARREE